MNRHLLIFIYLIIQPFRLTSQRSQSQNTCRGRWQFRDALDVKVTFDWEINQENQEITIEFRTNIIAKGFWHGFTVSSDRSPSSQGSIFPSLMWSDSKSPSIISDLFKVTDQYVSSVKSFQAFDTIFQRLFSSGLLTVRWRPLNDYRSKVIGDSCLVLSYARGRVFHENPRTPEEIRSHDRPLCIQCSKNPSTIKNSAIKMIYSTTEAPTAKTYRKPACSNRMIFSWLGRMLEFRWINQYSDLQSIESLTLRSTLADTFNASLIKRTLCSMSLNDFRLLGLQSHFGLVIFLAEIELITCQTRDQTIDFVQELVESLNQTMNYALGLKKTENYMLQNRIRLQEALQEQRALSNMKHSIKLENDNIFTITMNSLIGTLVIVGCFLISIVIILGICCYKKYQHCQYQFYQQNESTKFPLNRTSRIRFWRQASASVYHIQSTTTT